MPLTCPFTARLFHTAATGTLAATSLVEYPHKYAGKPAQLTADAFLAVVRQHEVTADVVKVQILDNKGNKGVLATAVA